MHLHIKLRDGFNNNTVTIRVNGKQVYHKSGVRTDLTISFADSVEILVTQAIAKLELMIDGEQRVTKEIQVQETPFVDVWIIDGEIQLRESDSETPML